MWLLFLYGFSFVRRESAAIQARRQPLPMPSRVSARRRNRRPFQRYCRRDSPRCRTAPPRAQCPRLQFAFSSLKPSFAGWPRRVLRRLVPCASRRRGRSENFLTCGKTQGQQRVSGQIRTRGRQRRTRELRRTHGLIFSHTKVGECCLRTREGRKFPRRAALRHSLSGTKPIPWPTGNGARRRGGFRRHCRRKFRRKRGGRSHRLTSHFFLVLSVDVSHAAPFVFSVSDRFFLPLSNESWRNFSMRSAKLISFSLPTQICGAARLTISFSNSRAARARIERKGQFNGERYPAA